MRYGAEVGPGGASREPPLYGPFYSDEPGVAETATAIDERYPSAVIGITVQYRTAAAAGFVAGDLDIVTSNYIIQVMTEGARRLGSQIVRAQQSFPSKTVVGFAPDINPNSGRLRAWTRQGLTIYTDLESLLQGIGRGNGP